MCNQLTNYQLATLSALSALGHHGFDTSSNQMFLPHAGTVSSSSGDLTFGLLRATPTNYSGEFSDGMDVDHSGPVAHAQVLEALAAQQLTELQQLQRQQQLQQQQQIQAAQQQQQQAGLMQLGSLSGFQGMMGSVPGLPGLGGVQPLMLLAMQPEGGSGGASGPNSGAVGAGAGTLSPLHMLIQRSNQLAAQTSGPASSQKSSSAQMLQMQMQVQVRF